MIRLLLILGLVGNYTMSAWGITHDHYPLWWFACDVFVGLISLPQLIRA
jgi:hypothetical protein